MAETAVPRPSGNDPDEWRAYWTTLSQEWRTEPEISAERQKELARLRASQPDPEQEPPPFQGVKLTRADIEWLLATHEREGVIGPLVSRPLVSIEPVERQPLGVDLRDVQLVGADLVGLPLNRVLFNHAVLIEAHLEGAQLLGSYLEGTDLFNAHLEGTQLSRAHLEGADLVGAFLEGASLIEAHLEGAQLLGSYLEGTDLTRARLKGADLCQTQLQGANLRGARLEGVNLGNAHLEGKVFDANDPDFKRIRRWMPHFPQRLSPADLSGAFFDATTSLHETVLGTAEGGAVRVRGVRWGGVNLTDEALWMPVRVLGDERVACEKRQNTRKPSQATDALREAVQANRQLATELRGQGMNEVADRFAYRAQLLRRAELWWTLRWWQRMTPHRGLAFWLRGWRIWVILAFSFLASALPALFGISYDVPRWEGPLGFLLMVGFVGLVGAGSSRTISLWIRTLFSLLGSLFLWALAGYGYRPGRAVLLWAVVVLGGTAAFYVADQGGGWLGFREALIESINAFHGRGVFYLVQGQRSYTLTQGGIAAVEAVCGLVIEATFIATFTQRFFGR